MNRVLIADPSPLFRAGIKKVLAQSASRVVTLETACLERVRRLLGPDGQGTSAGHRRIGLVIVDRGLPGLDRFNLLTEQGQASRSRVLLMAEQVDDSFVGRARAAGIDGVIDKAATAAQFAEAVSSVGNGARWYWKQPDAPASTADPAAFSEIQYRVLGCIQQGMSNKQIAASLDLNLHRVKYQIAKIYRKAGIQGPNRPRLALLKLPPNESIVS